MDYLSKIISDIELHSVDGLNECFGNGVDTNAVFNNRPLIDELISEYTRTDRFKDCVKAFVDHGLNFPDNALLAVLMDDADTLEKEILADPGVVSRQYQLRCAYTPLDDATLLHVCAEFNHLNCARVLAHHHADVNAKAAIDEHGFGGQTPIFHTVNQNSNHSLPMLEFLLSAAAHLDVHVKGIVWGKGYPWETLIPSVDPISYAMMGLLPQMHRSERDIHRVIRLLMKERYGIDYEIRNVPNAYLRG